MPLGISNPRGNLSQNIIIHGDNLEALKALPPEYEGKIDCIYIDPPYNVYDKQQVEGSKTKEELLELMKEL